ncbi:MAG: hypothetical protein BHW07_01065 [Clostridium sp. CAG_433_25_7]|nr:MAG: hypothetical protein BHW07_01065 [Clostridium sp. CAG_433_25_7]
MNKKYLIIFLLFFITLLLTGYIYCDYKEKQITKNNDNVTKEETKKENDISEEKGKDFAAEKVVLKGEENVKRVVKKVTEEIKEEKKEEINSGTITSYYGNLIDAKKEGYTFIGWYNKKGKKINENSVVTERGNHTLYAKYKINSYIIKFDYNYLENNLYKNLLDKKSYNLDYEIINDDEIFNNENVFKFNLSENVIKYKENIKLDKDKIYTFSVYLKSDSEKELMIGFNGEEEKIKVNENFNRFTKTFKAEKIEGDISKDSYLEIYDLSISEGEENTKEEEINYNEKVETKEAPLREGYTFDGWYKDLSLKEKVNDSVKEDATYYAKWIPNTYTLKLEVNGKVTEVKGSFNSLKKLEIPKSNYKITYDEREVFIKRTFKGWVNENNETAIENYIFKKDEKLKAVFEDTVNVQLEDINKENNICSWNTKKSGNGESYDAKTTININSDIKLYSVCKQIIKPERPINSGTITSYYGKGIDMSSSDKNIYPVLPGVVAKTGSNSSMGNYIIIHHTYNNQNYTSAYYHLEEKYVRKNQKVDQNTVIGKMGQTGIATGVHLHLTMYKGHLDSENSEMIDPKSVIDLPSNWNSRVY